MRTFALLLISLFVSCFAQETLFRPFEVPEDLPLHYDNFRLGEIYHHGISKDSNIFMKIKVKEDRNIYDKIAFFKKLHKWKQNKQISEDGVSKEILEEKIEQRFVPNPADKNTVMLLANMSYNSYENYNTTKDWQAIPGFDVDSEFGWKSDGIRGYVFGNSDNSLLVIAIKGTTFTIFGSGETSENDKFMDNLMFSCCCARIDSSFETVCGCFSGGSTCNNTCLRDASIDKGSYYLFAQDIYKQIRASYPQAQIWVTGHSLGGGLAGVVAATNDIPAFTYEAPGDLLYALRLGLKVDPSNLGSWDIFQFGNRADPIFTGECVGKLSGCYQFGYAIETKCHVGYTCTYDGGLISNINNHRISVVIDKFIKPMNPPPCIPQNNCIDCAKWTFFD